VKELASWTPRRVIVACVLWMVGAPVVGALGLVLGMLVVAALSGHQSIGFSARLTDLSASWLFGPPLLLVGAWIWARTKQRRSAGAGSPS
jgi:hypothetical protein